MQKTFGRGLAAMALGLLLVGCRQGTYEAPKVTPSFVHERMEKGENLLFVDVRSSKSFDKEHIAGAVNVPAARFGGDKLDLPKDRWMVLYCTCVDEHSSLRAANALHDKYQYDKLLVLKGGMQDWKKAGYATTKGAKALAGKES